VDVPSGEALDAVATFVVMDCLAGEICADLEVVLFVVVGMDGTPAPLPICGSLIVLVGSLFRSEGSSVKEPKGVDTTVALPINIEPLRLTEFSCCGLGETTPWSFKCVWVTLAGEIGPPGTARNGSFTPPPLCRFSFCFAADVVGCAFTTSPRPAASSTAGATVCRKSL
jgi:hypothetical protein